MRTLLLLLVLLALPAAPAAADINGFEGGDGDQACAAGADWACLAAPVTINATPDPVGGGDDVFAGGKEDEPASWTFATGGTGDKTDVAALWSADVETESDSFLYLAFARAGGEGNAFFTFELNQVRANWPNPQGASVPCRTDGDVLVSYEIPSTTSDPVTITMYRWQGAGGPAACPDGAAGSWQLGAGPAAGREGAINDGAIANALPGAAATLADATFGEAALDLGAVVSEVGITKPCEFFTRMQAHSRQSVSLSSSMGDYVDAGAIQVAACKDPGPGPDTEPPAAPTLEAAGGCTDAVVLSGIAEPGSQVHVREGADSRGLAEADPVTGAWTLTLAGVADGPHTYTARARDAAANVSEPASIGVTVDTVAPAAPVVTSPAAGATVAPGDLTLTGSAEPGSTVTVSEAGQALGATTAAAGGAWSVTVSAAAGAHAYEVTAADACAASAPARVDVVAGTAAEPPPGPGGPLGPATPPAAPQGAVLPTVVAGGCVRKPFSLAIPARGVKRVHFRVDGRQVAVVRRAVRGRFTLRVDPRAFRAGLHRTSARIVPRKGRSRTVPMRSFTACEVGQCVSRRSFPIRVKRVRGDRVVSARVYVNGKRVRVVRGKRLRSRVRLTGLPKGRFVVRIVSRLASGRTSVDERTYRTCTKRTRKPARRR